MTIKSLFCSIKKVLGHKNNENLIEPTIEDIESSYCGLDCKACEKYADYTCMGCIYISKKIQCPIYLCANGRGFTSCNQCQEVHVCEIRHLEMEKCKQYVHENFSIESGTCYLINEVKVKITRDIFMVQASRGKQCLWITGESPHETRLVHDLHKTPIVYLTQEKIRGEYCLNSKHCVQILDTISEFVKKSPGSTIIFDNFKMLLNDEMSIDYKHQLLVLIQGIFNAMKEHNATLFIVAGMECKFIEDGDLVKLPNPSYIEWLRPIHIETICNELIRYLPDGNKDINQEIQKFTQLKNNNSYFSECSLSDGLLNCAPSHTLSRSDSIDKVRIFSKYMGYSESDANVKSIIYNNLSAFGYSPYEYLIRRGNSYVVTDLKLNANDIFNDAIKHGIDGLCISRSSPDDLVAQYPYHNITIVQLTQVRGKNHISPTALGQIQNTILSHIKEHGEGIVFFDGLEYLITHNGFTKILQFIQYIKDYVQDAGCILIIPLSKEAFTEQEFALIERDFKKIEYIESEYAKDGDDIFDIINHVMA